MNYCNFHTGLCDGHKHRVPTSFTRNEVCAWHIYEAKPFKDDPLGKIMFHSV